MNRVTAPDNDASPIRADVRSLEALRNGGASLAGVRVLDLSRVLAGPYATMMLGDLGADIIKVEAPGGDDTRHWLPPIDDSGRSTYFASVNRNKRATTLDFNIQADLARAQSLASGADIVIENFRPGVTTKYQLDYEHLRQSNSRLIYCSITGFGDGKGAALPGYDLIAQAVGGLMSITGLPGGEPYKAGVALVDVLTGMNAVIGILAALRAREASDQGQHVQVNLLQSLLSALVNQASGALATGQAPQRMGNAHPSVVPYESFGTGDGDIVIAVGNDRQFTQLARCLQIPELATDPRFSSNHARVEHRAILRGLIEDALGAGTSTEWSERLTTAGVPAGRVNDVLEAIQLAENLGLEPVVTLGPDKAPHSLIANPIRLSGSPVTYRLPPPDLLEQNISWLE